MGAEPDTWEAAVQFVRAAVEPPVEATAQSRLAPSADPSGEEDDGEETIGSPWVLFHEEGNRRFKEGDKDGAAGCFTKALQLLCEQPRKVQDREQERKAVLYNNRAAALLALDKPDLACADAQRAVAVRPKWHKAHYRLGTALIQCGGHGAAEALREALSLLPAQPAEAAATDGAAIQKALKQAEQRESRPGLLVHLHPTPNASSRHPVPIPDPWCSRARIERVEDYFGGGWGIVAAQDLGAGEFVFCETPLCSFTLNERCCAVCTTDVSDVPGGGLRCERCCGAEVYCSTDCQQAAWQDWHEPHCRAPGESDSVAERMMQLRDLLRTAQTELSQCMAIFVAVRLIGAEAARINRMRRTGDDGPIHPLRFALGHGGLARLTDGADKDFLHNMQYSHDVRLAQFEKLLEVLGPGACHPNTRIQYGDVPFDFMWYRDMWLRVAPNAIDICPLSHMEVCSLLGAGSFFNHDCDPNVTHLSLAGKESHVVMFKTLRPVKKGEQLTISYVEDTQTVWHRRERLRASYGFLCACQRCLRETGEID
eukprot:TRINITY_DN14015_c0_g3_i1.p1 TRINITY_DN14015_c0_g3~~TRINITY_DN14015_c0_g3_i1.p1  ORF type:complete len:539 (+),score=146.58 TRINITY_DN14015_c0_g3_i1:87-1703(+)